jgi:3-isopropylmalate/(R)-2-methylmalate dehydratase large subunit
MSIEAGARAGLVAPDEKTFAYIEGRPFAPQGSHWEKAVSYWRTLYSDDDAAFDVEDEVDIREIVPQVTWGTTPEDVVPVDSFVPRAEDFSDDGKRTSVERSLKYMGLEGGEKMTDIAVDRVFIGSCTNGRIEDLRDVAKLVLGGRVHESVRAMIVPGSGLVRDQAEGEGLTQVFKDAGFEWREPGCSMCLGMNEDQLSPGERCASTSNRNFEGRQGKGGRTHLMSPVMAACAALQGHISDVREFVS